MVKFTLKIVIFFSMIFIIIMTLPEDRELVYDGLENDCANHGSWMHDRIYKNPEPVDIAFVGSSHTMNGIDSKLIQNKLNDQSVLNFGYCRMGRNVHYILTRELIEKKHPKIIVLEIREFENPYSHPIFAYMAENRDLFSSYPWFNKDWFSDLSVAFEYRLQILQEQLWKGREQRYYDQRHFSRIALTDTATVEELSNKQREKEEGYKPAPWKVNFNNIYPMHYLQRIMRLCEETDTKLILLYIPAYGDANQQPYQVEKLAKDVPVWLPPSGIWGDKNHWHDPNHLNQSGAEELSNWVVGKLIEENTGKQSR